MGSLKETIHSFILKLRRSDEPTKRRWVIGLSGGMSLIILFLWVGYLNISIPKLSPPPDVIAAGTETVTESEDNSGSFFGVLGRGFRNITENFKKSASSIGNTFSSTFENAKKSFGGTKTDVFVSPPDFEKASEPLFLDLNGTSSPTSSPITE